MTPQTMNTMQQIGDLTGRKFAALGTSSQLEAALAERKKVELTSRNDVAYLTVECEQSSDYHSNNSMEYYYINICVAPDGTMDDFMSWVTVPTEQRGTGYITDLASEFVQRTIKADHSLSIAAPMREYNFQVPYHFRPGAVIPRFVIDVFDGNITVDCYAVKELTAATVPAAVKQFLADALASFGQAAERWTMF